MNLLHYTDKRSTIDNKLRSLLAQINYDYQNGNIRTETEYYYRIKNMLSDFYTSLTKPTFKFRPAVSTPMSDEYNAMIIESYNDMEYIIKDCEALSELVEQSFTDAELSRNMMTNELAQIAKEISTMGNNISTNQGPGVVVFSDAFNDVSMLGNELATNHLEVRTHAGILTLANDKDIKIYPEKIEIDPDESNGFPGNSHVVDTLHNGLHFVGQEGLHNNLLTLCDDAKDSWFEFELFSISDETRQQCNSLGFEYDEGVSWVNNDDILRLKLIVTMPSEQTISWLTIMPYLSEVKGVKSCFLEKCEIITASNNVYLVGENIAFDETLTFPFPPQAVKRVEFAFVQPTSYAVKAGHFYYTEADTANMSIFQDYDYTDMFARVDGPKPSVSLLGCKYNPETQWLTYSDSKQQKKNILSETLSKDGLFSLPESTIEKKSNEEMIDAQRYMIGIRQIEFSTGKFKLKGEYVSKLMTTDEVITSITLESDEFIPGDNPEILRYFISLNGGLTWHKIYPIHRACPRMVDDGKGGMKPDNVIYKYYVNNDSIENLICSNPDDKRSKNLSVVGEPKSVQLKIEMDRPTGGDFDIGYSTPVVYGYKLKLTTGGETFEY